MLIGKPSAFCQDDAFVLSDLTVPLPLNEARRLEIVRETNLLDSFDRDPEFDRYTALGRRIFKVPICLVTLIDRERQWFKSRNGLGPIETHRNLAFCTYVCLPQSPDVFVVLDSLKDPRFCNNSLVTGPPHVLFYAGAALIVDGVKIGSFCIIDTKPWPEFTLSQKQNLLDIGSQVSLLISMQRNEALFVKKQEQLESFSNPSLRNVTLQRLTHNLRTPLASMLLAIDNLKHELEGHTQDTVSAEVRSRLLYKLIEASGDAKYLQQVVSACLILAEDLPVGQAVRKSNTKAVGFKQDRPVLYATECDMHVVLDKVQRLLGIITEGQAPIPVHFDDADLRWEQQERAQRHSNETAGTYYFYPDLFLVLVITTICRLMELSNHMSDALNVVAKYSHDERRFHVSMCCAKGGVGTAKFTTLFGIDSNSGQAFTQKLKVLKILGGDLTTTCTEEGDAVVDLYVPCEPVIPPTPIAIDPNSLQLPFSSTPTNKPLQTLIVDDSQVFVDAVTAMLAKYRCTVTAVPNGILGLIKLRASTRPDQLNTSNDMSVNVPQFLPSSFDVVFVDLLMPAMHGVEMMTRMRSLSSDGLEGAVPFSCFENTAFYGMIPLHSHLDEYFPELQMQGGSPARGDTAGFTGFLHKDILDLNSIEQVILSELQAGKDDMAHGSSSSQKKIEERQVSCTDKLCGVLFSGGRSRKDLGQKSNGRPSTSAKVHPDPKSTSLTNPLH